MAPRRAFPRPRPDALLLAPLLLEPARPEDVLLVVVLLALRVPVALAL
ncbi:MAG: hypothetical protein ACTHJW_08320 [Streptosporangiaceae bacterium]